MIVRLLLRFFSWWAKKEALRPPVSRLVFRDDGTLAERKAPFCLSHSGQKAVRYNIRAAGLRSDAKRVDGR